MNKALIAALILSFVMHTNLMSQEENIFKVKFVPKSVTYNGSPDPNECWESVVTGIEIKTEKLKGFFSLPAGEIEILKSKIGENEIMIEVTLYEEPMDGSGEIGNVEKIWLNNELIYENNG